MINNTFDILSSWLFTFLASTNYNIVTGKVITLCSFAKKRKKLTLESF